MALLEVRIRLASWSTTDSLPLGEIPFRQEAIDAVLPLLEKWGGYIAGVEFGGNDLSGQFSADDGKAFFEVIVDDATSS